VKRLLLALQPLRGSALLLLVLAALIPLLPSDPLPLLAGLRPAALLSLLCLLLGLQLFGHLAVALAGPHTGLLLAGTLGGMVSSTATVLALGARARAQPVLARACAAGAVMSCMSTWLQALLMLLALAPQAALLWAPVALAGAGVALAAGLWLVHETPAPDRNAEPVDRATGLGLRQAMLLALLLSAVTGLVGWAQQQWGSAGLYVSVALAGLADAHAPLASLAALLNSAQIGLPELLGGMLLAIAGSSLTRGLGAWMAGGAAYARPVVGVLVLGLAAASAIAWAILAARA
jgi:uncharacterized membrane protein (DUF4010 family)